MAKKQSDLLVLLIGVFKLVKTALLVAVGVGALSMRDGSGLSAWLAAFAKDVENKHIDAALAAISNVDPHRLREIGAVSFAYAALFLVEGIGLLLRKLWAEYFTIVITTSFVPLEVYELIEKTSPTKALLLAVNLAVVVYLVLRLRRDHHWPFRR